MKKILLPILCAILIFSAIAIAAEDEYPRLFITVKYVNETHVGLQGTEMIIGTVPVESEFGRSYFARIYSIKDSEFFQTSVDFDLDASEDCFGTENQCKNAGKIVTFQIPYQADISYLEISNGGIVDLESKSKRHVMSRIDLMEYNRCNLDNICDANEDHNTCPMDCTEPETNNTALWLTAILVFWVIVGFGAYYFFFRKRK